MPAKFPFRVISGIGKHCPEQVWTEFTPPGAGTVGNDAHQRITEHIPETGYQHYGTVYSCRYSESICIKNKDPEAHHVPYKVRCRVAKAISDFFSGIVLWRLYS
jgi:hypothetical protein